MHSQRLLHMARGNNGKQNRVVRCLFVKGRLDFLPYPLYERFLTIIGKKALGRMADK